MNLAKAREHFSAYYEGSLERGLRQTFENRLKEDAQVQAEYRAFERTMQSLEALGRVEVEPPSDLHDKIAARLDKAIYDQKRQAAPVFSLANWWKGLIAVGVAAVGIAVGFGLQARHGSSEASVLGSGSSAPEQFSFAARKGAVAVSYPSVDHQTIIFKDATGKVFNSIELDHRALTDVPIQNQGDSSFLVSVETSDQSSPVSFVAVPGKVLNTTTSGKGTVKDLALAIAGHFNKPVIIQAKDDADKDASWDFSSNDVVASATAALNPLNLAVSEETSGVITIQKN
ncbi:MAG TPA: hypothetical protein VGL56_14105 [Fimbriimonadaceae bacterium]|jgi:hypothetical protein